jgi:hypothetical protein
MARGGKRKKSKAGNKDNCPEEEEFSHRVKRIFYIFLDIIILVSFSMALYFICLQDYTRTILSLTMGTLLLLFFIVKRAFKKRMK